MDNHNHECPHCGVYVEDDYPIDGAELSCQACGVELYWAVAEDGDLQLERG